MSARDLLSRIKHVRAAERGITPDQAWVSRTRGQLMMQVRNSMPKEKVAQARRVSGFFASFIPSTTWQAIQRPVLAAFSMIAIVGGGSLAGVSSAEHAGPGDLLYPIKLATEQTRLILTPNSSDRLQLKTEFVDRRTQELRQLVASNASDEDKQAQLKKTTQLLKRDLDTMKSQLNEVSSVEQSPQRLARLARDIDEKSNALVSTLKEVRSTAASDDTRQLVAEAESAAVNTGVRAVQVLIDASKRSDTDVSKEDLLKSIQQRVNGIQQTIQQAPTSTSATTTSRLKDAQKTIDEAQQLLQDKDLDAVRDQLTEVVKAVTTVEIQDIRETTASPIETSTSTTSLDAKVVTTTKE